MILARQQLFTENTLTAVLPVMSKPTLANAGRLLRLWTVVLVGNLCGTLLVAYVMLHLPIFDTRTDQAFLEIGRKVMENAPGQMFAKGIVSGWMIATMVWMIPSMESAKLWIILITYLMALGISPTSWSARRKCLTWYLPVNCRGRGFLADIRRADPGRQYHWRQLYLCADQSCADPQRKQLAGKVAADPRHPQRINKDQ